MNRFKWIIGAAMLGAVSLTSWLLVEQMRENAGLRRESLRLKQQLVRLGELQQDNERLSNLVAQADGEKPNQQLLEVLRLRGEVGLLRRQTNEFQQAKVELERLRTSVADQSAAGSGATNISSEPLAVYPKDQWEFAGYDTPEKAFQSLNWAALNGDLGTLKSNLTEEAQKEFARSFENKSEAQIREQLMRIFSEKSEARILSKEVINDNMVALKVSDGGKSDSGDKLIFQKIDGQWKFVMDH